MRSAFGVPLSALAGTTKSGLLLRPAVDSRQRCKRGAIQGCAYKPCLIDGFMFGEFRWRSPSKQTIRNMTTTQMTFPLRRIASAILLVAPCIAFANPDLGRFGLTDVREAAECVTQKMPASVNKEVALSYWGPPAMTNGTCAQPRRAVGAAELATAKHEFLKALSLCTGQRQTTDQGIWVQRVAYAVSVYAAAGIQDWISAEPLLDRLVKQTIECEPKR
jgi:hypothetical protein